MRKILCVTAVAFSLACLMPAPAVLAAEGGALEFVNIHRVGLGANYWKTVDNIDVEDIHETGFSYLLSYQYVPIRYVKVEADLEYFPRLAEGGKAAWAPELFVTAGGLFYVGVGMGVYYHNDDWGNAPFYMLRAGLDFPIAPRLFLDINLNYRFNDWHTLNVREDVKTNTIRLGAALRFTI